MLQKSKAVYCGNCSDNGRARRSKVALHFILSVFTLGVWLIIWLWPITPIMGWRCTTCGSRKITKKKSTKIKPVDNKNKL